MKLDYEVVDVFTKIPLEGNPLAVFYDGRDVDDVTMQRIARELSLSETTFVFPPERPGAVAKVRIFTPRRELRFAGHPTIGTASVLRARGMVPRGVTRFVLDEGVGPVAVRVDESDGDVLWLTTPSIVRGETPAPGACAHMLGLSVDDLLDNAPPRICGTVDGNLFVPVRSVEAVDRAELDAAAFRLLTESLFQAPTCTFVFAATTAGAYSRMFAPTLGIIEDPATGSATGPLAALMMDYGLVSRASGSRFVSEQGTKMGRRSFLQVLITGEHGRDAIEVGGHVTPVVTASMTLSDV
ncbi:MAG: PhzF family phenazine biosynthesis protein [Vulcanimicrobiaceae bacterium]